MEDQSDSDEFISAEEDNQTGDKDMPSAMAKLDLKEEEGKATAHENNQETDEREEPSNKTPDKTPEVEYMSNLDNRYVSEDVEVKGECVELTEEQVKVRVERPVRLHVVVHALKFSIGKTNFGSSSIITNFVFACGQNSC